jgi:hypothetical protein
VESRLILRGVLLEGLWSKRPLPILTVSGVSRGIWMIVLHRQGNAAFIGRMNIDGGTSLIWVINVTIMKGRYILRRIALGELIMSSDRDNNHIVINNQS